MESVSDLNPFTRMSLEKMKMIKIIKTSIPLVCNKMTLTFNGQSQGNKVDFACTQILLVGFTPVSKFKTHMIKFKRGISNNQLFTLQITSKYSRESWIWPSSCVPNVNFWKKESKLANIQSMKRIYLQIAHFCRPMKLGTVYSRRIKY